MKHLAQPDQQQQLFTIPPNRVASTNAAARNLYGTTMQDIACAALGLEPIPINGQYTTNFDAKKNETYYEIKSVRQKGGKVVVYKSRLTKEQAAGVEVNYCIVRHDIRNARRTSDIAIQCQERPCDILITGLADVVAAVSTCPLRKLGNPSTDPRNGYSRPGYIEGYYNIPIYTLVKGDEIITSVDINLYDTYPMRVWIMYPSPLCP